MSAGWISDDVRSRVEGEADHRCGYCLSHQKYVFGRLEIDHITPRARGGTNDPDNLWLACRLCNGFKGPNTHGTDPLSGELVRLFNPRQLRWKEHFAWAEDGRQIVGLTAQGRATVVALQLNNPIAMAVRGEWISAGWHPPSTASTDK